MSRRFWTSDTHFGHKMMAERRGFANVHDHDAAIINNVNAIVGPRDIVWHLGDVGLGSGTYIFECMRQLNGTWHLITGNHDAPWPGHRRSHSSQRKWLDIFASVQAFGRVQIGNHELLMSHFPYEAAHTEEPRAQQYRLRDKGEWLLAGHTHSESRWHGPKQIHVGLDAWDLKPVSEEQILELLGCEWLAK